MSRLLFVLMLVTLVGCPPPEGDESPTYPPIVIDLPDGDGDGQPDDQDCDPGDPTVRSGEPEICDGKDNDCDGLVDEGLMVEFYQDVDEDGFGDPETRSHACEVPEGAVEQAGDCDDTDASINPDAEEVCDGLDNDCDDGVDNNAIDTEIWFNDRDQDGYGDPNASLIQCDQPEGYITVTGDCDDTDASVHPGQTEVCDGKDNNCDGFSDDADAEVDLSDASVWYLDEDQDGYGQVDVWVRACVVPAGYISVSGDCDDANASVNPDATEICNQIDDDCDGGVDDDAEDARRWYVDEDLDGFGSDEKSTFSCERPQAATEVPGDCNDQNPTINPDAIEICDGKDNDCDGKTDDYDNDVDLSGATDHYADVDQDGFGSEEVIRSCGTPYGYVDVPGDCNDEDPAINPSVQEDCGDMVDNDCDGLTDNPDTVYFDQDGDGYGDAGEAEVTCETLEGYVTNAEDCDDQHASVHPKAAEICNQVDDNCNGLIDEDPEGAPVWYLDSDQDGYGTLEDSLASCAQPEGYTANHQDCNDFDDGINPDATEVCDSIDNNCDGFIDDTDRELDTDTAGIWYPDLDEDGYGAFFGVVYACQSPEGYITQGGDCNDTDPTIHPGATEICDGNDNDCDGIIDPETAVGVIDWYLDSDQDGYGSSEVVRACEGQDGYVSSSTDCNDADATIHPDATEQCDGKDNNCNDLIDEDVQETFYADQDKDGYGDASDSQDACTEPSGFVSDDTDCDDTDANIHPDAAELCDEIDHNCDGSLDAGVVYTTYYLDSDQDGYGDLNASSEECVPLEGSVTNADDCDDTNSAIHPGATEVCDHVDNDCNSQVDEGVTNTYYLDVDEDGYGSDQTIQACTITDGYASNQDDCDDTSSAINPGVDEICNDHIDNDCSGDAPECELQSTYLLSQSYATWTSQGTGDELGDHLLGGCDLNNDGRSDLVISATENDSGTSQGGAVYILTTALRGRNMVGVASTKIYGSAGSGSFGAAFACGDLNNDGHDDLVVGAPGVSSSTGRIHVFFGPISGGTKYDSDANATRPGLSSGDQLGQAVAVGDVDGDGISDLLIGAPGEDYAGSNAGGVYVEFGPVSTGTEPVDEYAFLLSGTEGDGAGASLQTLDLNADGNTDLVVGAPNADASGSLFLLEDGVDHSSASLYAESTYRLTGQFGGDLLGEMLASGDTDNDGRLDLLVGVPFHDSNDRGSLFVIEAPHSGSTQSIQEASDLVFTDSSDNNQFAADAATVDLNGDGYGDLIVGAPGDDSEGVDSGDVTIFLGPDFTQTIQLRGEAAGDHAGLQIEATGDMNGDGYDDVLVSAPRNGTGGAVYLFAGRGQ